MALQGNVIGHAKFLCDLFEADLHVVSAYSSARLPQADPEQTYGQVAAHHCLEQCRWFMEEYELPAYRLHVGEGPARELIPRIAHEFEATLTVLGTVARHGVVGALVGAARLLALVRPTSNPAAHAAGFGLFGCADPASGPARRP